MLTMPKREIRPFDSAALYEALDSRRHADGLSWAAVAREIWDFSAELNARRHDHRLFAFRRGAGLTTGPIDRSTT